MQEFSRSECNARVEAYQKALQIPKLEQFDIEKAKERTRQFRSSIETQQLYNELKRELYEAMPAPSFLHNYVQRLYVAVRVHNHDPLSLEGYDLLLESIHNRLKALYMKEDQYKTEIVKIEFCFDKLKAQRKKQYEAHTT
jgi:hypothetical protein